MKSIGATLFLIGVLTIVLPFFNYYPKITYWIYKWGEGTAWGIKIAIVVLGAILYFMGGRSAGNNQQNNNQAS